MCCDCSKCEFSAVILTGGKSSRMGRDKLQLKLGGKTLTEIAAEKALAAGAREILFAGGVVPFEKVRPVADAFTGAGPLAGIHTGLKHAANRTCLVLAADTPLVPAELLAALIARHRETNAEITLAIHGDKLEPLIGVYEKHLFHTAERLLTEGKYSVRGLMKNASCAFLTWQEEDAFANCNTPEEYEWLRLSMAEQKE